METEKHLLRPQQQGQYLHKISAQDYAWRFLDFAVLRLTEGSCFEIPADNKEKALVPLSGQFGVQTESATFSLKRKSVFEEMPHVLYLPPGVRGEVTANTSCEFAIGGAPATGKYPLRCFSPDEMKREVRGGGPAKRQVNHVLAYPLPAEKLILFEVHVPGGAWAGWPPHCHDGFDGSAYLEETYFFRFLPEEHGFGFQRNYRTDEPFNETFTVRHNDLVLVTKGFHPTVTSPGSRMFFLNYLAGDPTDAERARPPLDDRDWTHMKESEDSWNENRFELPAFDRDGKAVNPKD